MSGLISIFVPGEIKGLARPRASVIAGHVKMYDPAQNRNSKAILQNYLLKEWKHGVVSPGPKGFAVDLYCIFPIPKSMSKKNAALALDGKMRPQKKPDADNVIKAVLDAYNLVLWKDDSEVTKVSISKYYGETPGMRILITWEGDDG